MPREPRRRLTATACRPVRRGLHRPQRPRSRLRGGFPNNFSGVRDILYLHSGATARDIRIRESAFAGSRPRGSITASVQSSPTSTARAARSLRATTVTRPAGPERRLARRGSRSGGARLRSRSAQPSRRGRPACGDGCRGSDFNGEGGPIYDLELRGQGHAVYTGAAPRVGSCSNVRGVRAGVRQDVHRLGASGSSTGRQSRPRAHYGGIPVPISRETRSRSKCSRHGATGVRPPITAGPRSSAERPSSRRRPRPHDGRLRHDGRWTSPSIDRGKLELLRPTGAIVHGSRCGSPGSRPSGRDCCPPERRRCTRVQAGSSYLSSQDTRVHSDSRGDEREPLIVATRTSHRVLRHVPAAASSSWAANGSATVQGRPPPTATSESAPPELRHTYRRCARPNCMGSSPAYGTRPCSTPSARPPAPPPTHEPLPRLVRDVEPAAYDPRRRLLVTEGQGSHVEAAREIAITTRNRVSALALRIRSNAGDVRRAHPDHALALLPAGLHEHEG